MHNEDELEHLMERIKQRSSHVRPWTELINIAKNNMIEKPNVLDAQDREELKGALDFLQRTRKLTTPKELLEQLREFSGRLSFKFACTGNSVFLSSDSFYVEVKTSEQCMVEQVLIAHGKQPPEPCESLKRLLLDCDWMKLSDQLRALHCFYPSNSDSVTKSAAFMCLSYMENDVTKLSTLTSSNTDAITSTREGPVGLVSPRDGGQPLRVHYFLEPYDLLDVNNRCMLAPEDKDIVENGLARYGQIVTDSADVEQLLPQVSLLSGRQIKVLQPSDALRVAAKFVLRLDRPVALLNATVQQIVECTKFELPSIEEGNLLELLIKHAPMKPKRSYAGVLAVALPGQTHSYRLDVSCHNHLSGLLVDKISFTQPIQLLKIVELLRRQLLFNSVFESCVRSVSLDDIKDHRPLQIQLSSPSLSVFECLFERPDSPGHFGLATFNLSSANSLRVNVRSATGISISSDVSDVATRTFQKSWSIPVTMRTVFSSLGLTEGRFPNGTDDGGPGAEETTEDERMDGGGTEDSDKLPTIDDDAFWLSAAPRKSEWAKKISAAWLPSPVHSKNNEPFKFCVEKTNSKNGLSNNLLDIFKEIEIWKELIPPRPGQEPLKSPSLMPPLHMMQPQHPHPSPRLQEMLTCPSQSARAPDPPKLPHNRHWSTGSESSNTLSELELINMLASPANSNLDAMSALGNMSSGRPAPLCDTQRRSSIQDAIDSVVKEIGTLQEGAPSPTGFPMSLPLGVSPEQQAEFNARMAEMRPNMAAPSPPISGRRGAVPVSLSQSRSFDYGLMSSQARNDPFDFEKSDPIEAGLVSPTEHNRLVSPASAGPFYAAPSGMPPQNFPFPPSFPTNPQVKGRGAPAAARRSRGRKAANLGDRPPGEAPKEKKRSTAKRPRRARGAAAQVTTSELPTLKQAPAVSSIFPPAMSVASAVMKMAETLNVGQPFGSVPVSAPPQGHPAAPFFAPASATKPGPAPGLDMEESSEENSPSEANDDRIRQQIQEVLGSPQTSATGAARQQGAKEPNLFENLQTNPAASDPHTEASAGDGPGGSAVQKVAQSRAKPNILSRSNRKGSLDMVIGKLKDKVCDRVYTKRPLDDVFDSEIHSFESGEAAEQIAQLDALPESSEDPSPSTSDSDAIKVVIKKNLLTASPAPVPPKSSLLRQKSDPPESGAKSSKEKSSRTKQQGGSDKFAALKEKVQNRKRKQSDRPTETTKHVKVESKTAQFKSQRIEAPVDKRSELQMPPVFEGISRSLKGFKIPKLQEEVPPILSSQLPPKIQPEITKPVQLSPEKRTPPKPILKQSAPVQPPTDALSFAGFRPMGRKPLLPNPASGSAPPTVTNPIRFPAPKTQTSVPIEPSDVRGEPEVAEVGESSYIRSPDDSTIRSPDQTDLSIDDSVRSPNALNTSKDSSDRSPELTIVEGE